MGGMLVLGWMRRIVGFWGNTCVLFLCLPGMVMMQEIVVSVAMQKLFGLMKFDLFIFAIIFKT